MTGRFGQRASSLWFLPFSSKFGSLFFFFHRGVLRISKSVQSGKFDGNRNVIIKTAAGVVSF
jgi:hypothetical protein